MATDLTKSVVARYLAKASARHEYWSEGAWDIDLTPGQATAKGIPRVNIAISFAGMATNHLFMPRPGTVTEDAVWDEARDFAKKRQADFAEAIRDIPSPGKLYEPFRDKHGEWKVTLDIQPIRDFSGRVPCDITIEAPNGKTKEFPEFAKMVNIRGAVQKEYAKLESLMGPTEAEKEERRQRDRERGPYLQLLYDYYLDFDDKYIEKAMAYDIHDLEREFKAGRADDLGFRYMRREQLSAFLIRRRDILLSRPHRTPEEQAKLDAAVDKLQKLNDPNVPTDRQLAFAKKLITPARWEVLRKKTRGLPKNPPTADELRGLTQKQISKIIDTLQVMVEDMGITSTQRKELERAIGAISNDMWEMSVHEPRPKKQDLESWTMGHAKAVLDKLPKIRRPRYDDGYDPTEFEHMREVSRDRGYR